VIEGNKNDEGYTKGMKELPEMAKKFYGLGCRFAKWRAVLKIDENLPSDEAIRVNSEDLA
jgi:fructose-bisphosphate aldolase class I